MCELLRKIAALGLSGPITLVLDNARYQRNAVVEDLAKELGIMLLFPQSYSPKSIRAARCPGRFHIDRS